MIETHSNNNVYAEIGCNKKVHAIFGFTSASMIKSLRDLISRPFPVDLEKQIYTQGQDGQILPAPLWRGEQNLG